MTTITDLLPEYRNYLEHERKSAPATVRYYLYDLRELAAFWGGDVRQMDLNVLRAYQRQLSEKGLSNPYIKRKFAGFSTFWKWMRMEGYVEENVTERIRIPKPYHYIPAWLKEDELLKFVDTPCSNPRNALAFKTLAWLGLRRGELLNLRVRDVRFEDDLIMIRKAKGGRDRAMLLPPALKKEFEAICRAKPPDDFVFEGNRGGQWPQQSFVDAFHAHLAACGLEGRGITPHTLRHTFATLLLMRGVHLQEVKELLGHSSVTATMVYAHITSDRLRIAMSKHVLNERTEK